MNPPPLTLPESPEFWRQLGEWIADDTPLTETDRAAHLAVCEAPRMPVQFSLTLAATPIMP